MVDSLQSECDPATAGDRQAKAAEHLVWATFLGPVVGAVINAIVTVGITLGMYLYLGHQAPVTEPGMVAGNTGPDCLPSAEDDAIGSQSNRQFQLERRSPQPQRKRHDDGENNVPLPSARPEEQMRPMPIEKLDSTPELPRDAQIDRVVPFQGSGTVERPRTTLMALQLVGTPRSIPQLIPQREVEYSTWGFTVYNPNSEPVVITEGVLRSTAFARSPPHPPEKTQFLRINHQGHIVVWLDNVPENQPISFSVNRSIPPKGNTEIVIWFRTSSQPLFSMLKINGSVSFTSEGRETSISQWFPLWVYSGGRDCLLSYSRE